MKTSGRSAGRRSYAALAMAVGLAVVGCSPEDSSSIDGNVSRTASALTGIAAAAASVTDPVAFCRASGLNVIIGTSNNDTLNGTSRADCIVGLGGQDTINGLGGNDIIFGGDGDDVINGGDGDDIIFGGPGQDNIHGNAGNDQIFGEDGDDTLAGDDGADTISGGQGQDRITGGAGNDTLTGDDGDDRLDGGTGNDNLSDCSNHNVFVGGTGTNTCQGSTTGSSSSSFSGCQTVVACGANDWAQFQHDPVHSGANPVETAFTVSDVSAGPLTLAFKAHFGNNTTSEGGPVEADGILYATDSGSDADLRGRLSAFSAAGCGGPVGGSCEPLWQAITGGSISVTPAVGNGFVVLASREDTEEAAPFLFAYAAQGCGASKICQPVWRGVLADAVVDSSPAIANGIAYVGDFGGRIYAFDVVACGAAHNMNCQPLWTGQAGALEELVTAPVVGPHFVIISSFLVDFNLPSFGGKVNAFPIGGCGRSPNNPCPPTWTADLGGPGSGQTLSGSTVFVGGNLGVMAFNEAGCGGAVCKALRTYDTGDPAISAGVQGAPVVVGSTLLVSTENTPDFSTVGVVSAFSAAGTTGCKAGLCEPLWIGVNFANGFESSPAVAGGVVFVGKAPASGFPVDAGVFTYDLNGCGAGQLICLPLSFTQLGTDQVNLGPPLAIARGAVYAISTDNTDTHSNIYALTPP
jgi:RTX calcium-binding nonapeptide repeat (4 copies)/PQQ-like domain